MKPITTGALCAVAVAVLGNPAFAVPISFSFSATITETNGYFAQTGLEGKTIDGGFFFETDDLVRMDSPDLMQVQYFTEAAKGSTEAAYAWATFGSRYVPFPVYPAANLADIVFRDNCNPVYCTEPYYTDDLGLYARNIDVPLATSYSPDFIGTYHDVTLDVDLLSYVDLFDWTKSVPTDLVSLPFPYAHGVYSENSYSCPGQTFCTQDYNQIAFDINWMTRAIVETPPSTSVPEPGTLGLSLAAGLGFLLFRRRAPWFASPRVC